MRHGAKFCEDLSSLYLPTGRGENPAFTPAYTTWHMAIIMRDMAYIVLKALLNSNQPCPAEASTRFDLETPEACKAQLT